MKLLLFSDIHCSQSAARQLVSLSESVDLVIGAGDFATGRRGLKEIMQALEGMTRPCVFVPGNSESVEELVDACVSWPNARVLHGQSCKIDGQVFYGIGGGIPVTPFGSWSYDFTEEQAEVLLVGCPDSAVLISHSPPKGCLDADSSGRSLGSTAVRDSILATDAKLCVCGHIHASAGREAPLGQTRVVNAGPDGMVIEL